LAYDYVLRHQSLCGKKIHEEADQYFPLVKELSSPFLAFKKHEFELFGRCHMFHFCYETSEAITDTTREINVI